MLKKYLAYRQLKSCIILSLTYIKIKEMKQNYITISIIKCIRILVEYMYIIDQYKSHKMSILLIKCIF